MLETCLPPDLQSRLLSVQVDNHAPTADYAIPIFNGGTGELMRNMPAPNSLRVRRTELVKLLGEGIDIKVIMFFRSAVDFLSIN